MRGRIAGSDAGSGSRRDRAANAGRSRIGRGSARVGAPPAIGLDAVTIAARALPGRGRATKPRVPACCVPGSVMSTPSRRAG
jgi:hypothetical protein